MMKRKLKVAQAVALVITALIFLGIRGLPSRHNPAPAQGASVIVARAVDGDTLKLADGRRVRLIGIDTPELHYSEKLLRDARRTNKDVETIQSMGKRSAQFTKKLCEGKRVRLESDVTKSDRYGRMLAYAYLEDGIFINAEIIKEGYAQVMTIPPNVKYADYFLKLQREARDGRRGLWAVTDDL